MSSTGPVRCALIGLGGMGREHAAILAASPAAELIVCCDTDPVTAARVPAEAVFTTSMAEALASPSLEAVFVATPQSHHAEAVEAAVDLGLAVFCEKPISDTVAGADRIKAAAARSQRPVVIGHMYRFEPRYRAIHQAITAGRIGRLVHLAIRGLTPDFEGRALADRTSLAVENAIHGLDVLRWMAGDIDQVYAETSRTGVAGVGLPDALVATVRFAGGAIATVESDWALPSATGIVNVENLLVVGSAGMAWYDGRDSGAAIIGASAGSEYPGLLTYRDPAGTPYGLYRMEDEYFLAMVRDDRAWPIDIADARAALIGALAIDRSIHEERPVRMDEFARPGQ
jgi:predicted dehydrogenase